MLTTVLRVHQRAVPKNHLGSEDTTGRRPGENQPDATPLRHPRHSDRHERNASSRSLCAQSRASWAGLSPRPRSCPELQTAEGVSVYRQPTVHRWARRRRCSLTVVHLKVSWRGIGYRQSEKAGEPTCTSCPANSNIYTLTPTWVFPTRLFKPSIPPEGNTSTH